MTVRGYNLSWDSSNRSDTLLQAIRANRESYTDVKLFTEDGQMFRAHKLVLASSSMYFHDLFQMSSNFEDVSQNSPLVVALPDVQGNSLASVLSFIYDGQTQVLSTDIDLFTKTAKRLKVKGLTADESTTRNDSCEQQNIQEEKDVKDEPQDFDESELDENIDINQAELTPETDEATSCDKKVKVKKSKKSTKTPELTETVIIEKGNLKCPSCNFESKHYQSLKTHVAHKHKQRAQFKCNKCEQTFEESNNMNIHYKQEHAALKAPKNQFFNCHLCSYKSLKEENLERHLKFTYHENEARVNTPSAKEQNQSSVDLELDWFV